MTERENLLGMLSGGDWDHLPLDVWMTGPSLDMVEAHTGSRDEVGALDLSIRRLWPRYNHDPKVWRDAYREIGFEVADDAVIGVLGTVSDQPPSDSIGAAYHLLEMRHPLEVIESVDQLERLPWPDVHDPGAYADLTDRVADVHREGRASIGQMDCTAFEMSWYVRGMERLYLDLLDGNGIADWLLDWYTHRAEVAVEHYVRAGVDLVWLGDDVGTQRGMMMAAPFWREHLKPRLARVVERARGAAGRHIWIAYHSDGDIRPIIPDLIEIGIDILNPVQPECMPFGEVSAAYGDRLAFWGMVGTQTTMPFGTADDVRVVVSKLRRAAESGLRIVVSPTHAIEPDVPWENLEALVKEAKAMRSTVSL